MARFTALIAAAAVLVSQQVSAHFLLNYPPTIGFDDDLETTSPCGSFTPDFTKGNVTDFHVGGDSIALTSIHPEATWLFRATLDQTASSNWTTLIPDVVQTGLGDFCEPDIVIPATWAGSKGILQIVQDAPDGILYQCATVNFVAGTGTPPTACKNVTGLSASYTTDAALVAIATATGAVPSSAASSSASASATAKKSAANAVSPSFASVGSVVGLVTIALGTLAGCLLL